VSRLVLLAMLMAGFVLSPAFAAPATQAAMAQPSQMTLRTPNIVPVYYTWNHHRYDHRSWDAAHKRWHYY
jgi:hypothetical protein